MKIPDSIENLTTTVPASFIDLSPATLSIPIDEIILLFKKNLDIKTLYYFERGLAFMKNDMSNDKNILKNFTNLIIDTLCSALRASPHINEEIKNEIIVNFKKNIETLRDSFDSLYNIIYNINKQNYFLDKNFITAIIIGYALSTLKKTHNS